MNLTIPFRLSAAADWSVLGDTAVEGFSAENFGVDLLHSQSGVFETGEPMTLAVFQ